MKDDTEGLEGMLVFRIPNEDIYKLRVKAVIEGKKNISEIMRDLVHNYISDFPQISLGGVQKGE
jgi:hypothetical protein